MLESYLDFCEDTEAARLSQRKQNLVLSRVRSDLLAAVPVNYSIVLRQQSFTTTDSDKIVQSLTSILGQLILDDKTSCQFCVQAKCFPFENNICVTRVALLRINKEPVKIGGKVSQQLISQKTL